MLALLAPQSWLYRLGCCSLNLSALLVLPLWGGCSVRQLAFYRALLVGIFFSSPEATLFTKNDCNVAPPPIRPRPLLYPPHSTSLAHGSRGSALSCPANLSLSFLMSMRVFEPGAVRTATDQ